MWKGSKHQGEHCDSGIAATKITTKFEEGMRRLWAPKYYFFEKGKAGVKDEVPRETATLGYGSLSLSPGLWEKAFLKMLI